MSSIDPDSALVLFSGGQDSTVCLAWALERYRHSDAWARLSNGTRKHSEAIYRAMVETAGGVRLRDITVETIRAGR